MGKTMSLNIQQKHIKEMKKVGTLNGVDVHCLTTYGGLIVLTTMNKAEPEILALAPHLVVAKDIVEKKNKNIKWTD